jgi:hypothetical protein
MPQPKNYRLERDILKTINDFGPIRLKDLSSILYPYHSERYKDFRSFNSHIRKRLSRYLELRWVKDNDRAGNDRRWSLAHYGKFTLKMKLSLEEIEKKIDSEDGIDYAQSEGGPLDHPRAPMPM